MIKKKSLDVFTTVYSLYELENNFNNRYKRIRLQLRFLYHVE